jgi:hypothetical protein
VTRTHGRERTWRSAFGGEAVTGRERNVRIGETVRGRHGSPEAGRRTAEGFVPLLKDVPGFVAYHFADAGGGVMISMSVYEDQSGAEESSKREGEWDAENLAELMPNPPEITAGEVVAHG